MFGTMRHTTCSAISPTSGRLHPPACDRACRPVLRARPEAAGADLFDRDEAEAGPGPGVRRPGRHPDPRRADLGALPLGREQVVALVKEARVRPDVDLLGARPLRSRAGGRPGRHHAEGSAMHVEDMHARRRNVRLLLLRFEGEPPRVLPQGAGAAVRPATATSCSWNTVARSRRCWPGSTPSRWPTWRSAPRTCGACTTVITDPTARCRRRRCRPRRCGSHDGLLRPPAQAVEGVALVPARGFRGVSSPSAGSSSS